MKNKLYTEIPFALKISALFILLLLNYWYDYFLMLFKY